MCAVYRHHFFVFFSLAFRIETHPNNARISGLYGMVRPFAGSASARGLYVFDLKGAVAVIEKLEIGADDFPFMHIAEVVLPIFPDQALDGRLS